MTELDPVARARRAALLIQNDDVIRTAIFNECKPLTDQNADIRPDVLRSHEPDAGELAIGA